jgi:hypothetical protein
MIARASAYTGEEISAHVAFAYARLGESDLALQFAGDAVRRGYPLSAIKREPLFKDLVGDTRFARWSSWRARRESMIVRSSRIVVVFEGRRMNQRVRFFAMALLAASVAIAWSGCWRRSTPRFT